MISRQPLNFSKLGKNKPGDFTEGLFKKNIRLLFNNAQDHPANTLLIDNLREEQDYVCVNESGYRWLAQNYTGKSIMRPAVTDEQGNRKVLAYLKKVEP